MSNCYEEKRRKSCREKKVYKREGERQKKNGERMGEKIMRLTVIIFQNDFQNKK